MNMQSLTGQVLGQYELRDMLGFGGMGVAYRAHQRNLERDVAIKILFPGLAAEAGYIERFYREAKTAASLEHAHIVPVYDYGVQGELSYVVMRLLTGGSLESRMAQRLSAEKPLPSFGEISELLRQLASALDYAHSRGVIHRDIKPGNLMFDEHGLAYVVDFGIAKLMEATTSYTSTGTPVGTPMYMSPEQWRSETLTPAADQYALAISVYQLMTGKLPFEATTPYGILHKHLNEDPTPPEIHREDVPPAVRDVLEQALAKNPDDRWESVMAFAMAFDGAIRGQTGQLTGFFTAPLLKSSTKTMATNPLVMISANSPLVTLSAPARPAYKTPIFWIMGAALAITLAAVLFLLLRPDDEAPPAATLSQAELRQTVMAELDQTGTAQIDTRNTAEAQVAFALTSTATQWTPTPTQNLTATAALTQTESARATASQESIVEATVSARGTNTQAAIIQQTSDARETATISAEETAAQFVANLTATAGAATATPTPTDTPTNTRTPTATSTDTPTATSTNTPTPTTTPTFTNTPTVTSTPTLTFTPTPSPTATPVPNIRAIYDNEQFILINMSERPLNIRRLVFEQENADGDTLSFEAELWNSASASLEALPPGGCYQTVTGPATQTRPSSQTCPLFMGWFRATGEDKHFWIAAEPGAVFTVRSANSSTILATCEISAERCFFTAP